ncbi:MAG: PEP-CTERM sorting domain-containing protein [Phycisphaerales bacterium]
MKNVFALLAVAGLASAASATTYTDAQNELFDNGFGHLDITSVDVSHDATFITFVVNVRGSIDAGAGGSNWGKYCIGIDTGAVGGDTSNGWGRNVSWGSGQGIEFYVGSWADASFPFGAGAELRQMSGLNDNSNTLLDATYTTNTLIQASTSAFSQTISVSRAAIGMGGNGTFRFDIFTTGSNFDPGVDHLSRSDMATDGWGTQSVAGSFLSYTIPTPGALALMGMGGLVAARRRRA